MLINLLYSVGVFSWMLAMGHLFVFLDPFAYWFILPFFLLLVLSVRLYTYNCKTLELKDFVISILFTLACALTFLYFDFDVTLGNICYLFLSVFLGDIAFASGIRYKSLM